MATHLEKYLAEQLENPNVQDQDFLRTIQDLTRRYIEISSLSSPDIIYENPNSLIRKIDLSHIPKDYDVDRKDDNCSTLNHFIGSLGLEKRLINKLIRYSADPVGKEHYVLLKDYPLGTIRDLYNLAYSGRLEVIRDIGSKSINVLKSTLKDIQETGNMPYVDEEKKDSAINYVQSEWDISHRAVINRDK